MEEHKSQNDLQFSPLAIDWIANNASGLMGNLGADQHYMLAPGSNGIHLEPVSVPQWMHCQPTPPSSQNYVEFLSERGYPEIQKQMFYDISAQEEYLRPHKEEDFISTVTGLEHQFSIQKQNWNGEGSHACETYSGSDAAAPNYSSEARRKRSREQAYAADRSRRLRISQWLDALQELMPHSKVVGRAALLGDVIDHIKYLQYQVKELCRSRLGGESTSDSVIFLEGHGHYFLQQQMLNGPLEEMMGKLIDVYPSAATEMLQSRGLIVMPMTFAEGLREPMEMLDVQEKGAFPISK